VFRLPDGLVVWRAAGFVHPNTLAALLFPGAVFCAAAWVGMPLSRRSVALLAASVAGAATVLLTYSRSGLLALGFAMSAVAASCFAAPDVRRRLLRAGLLAALVAVTVRAASNPAALAEQFAVVRNTAAKLVRIAGGTAEGKMMGAATADVSQSGLAVRTLDDRKLMAETAGRVAREHPLLGAGPGNWRIAAPRLAAAGMNTEGLIQHPHNLYLMVLAESGVLGLAAFIFLMACLFWKAPWTGEWPGAAFRCAWAGVFAGFLAYSMFDVPVIHARGMNMAFLLGFLRWPLKGEKR
jgi:O-antigen ligase